MKKIELLEKNLKQALYMNRELTRINKQLKKKLLTITKDEDVIDNPDFIIKPQNS